LKAETRSGARLASQAGVTLPELLIVLVIVAVVAGMSIPSFSRAIENAQLRGATQSLATVYQQARILATQDNTSYEVLITPAGASAAQACIDLDGDGICGAGDPVTVFSQKVIVSNIGVPLKMGSATLGFVPQDTEHSQMFDQQNQLAPGLAWNGRGIPCERTLSSIAPCLAIGWVQYLQFQRSGGDIAYAAVSVSPTGRVRTWTFIPSGNGNGKWL
jgi:prepilin-type N-terminal cleavage/methylation domain-containing protein